MPELPSGTVTFLFTDIEGSTMRWEHQPEAMAAALARHDALIRAAIQEHNGHVVKTMGDAFHAVFVLAPDGVAAALNAQRRLQAEPWDEVGPIRVRMAVHTGAAEERDGDYYGPPLNRAARLMSAGHGGQILLSQSTYELVRDTPPDGVTFVDLGEHRLKDLIRPERVFQLLGSGISSDFPRLRSLNSRPQNLPIQMTPLLGREREIAAARERLLQDDVRLLTLTGPGGPGKTRLALQVAAELIDHFADGVFFVELAPISDPALVPAAVAQTLGIRDVGGRPVLDTLKDYLGPRQILLVLDNFEQILSAATVVSELLRVSQGLKVLVTSRAPLELRGEHEFPVPPLALPDPKHPSTVESVSQYAAVALFSQRAAVIRPDFALTNQNAPAVAEICVRLDGLPLAIELAAARIRLLNPQAMLGRLERRLPLLTGGARDLPTRQRTLRDTIAWSYDLLDEGERVLFRRLSIFVGGCTLDAAEAVCDIEGDLGIDVLDGMASLVTKSLLRQEQMLDGELRFTMLETIREYATELLAASGEVMVLRDRHLDCYLALARIAEGELRGSRQAEWFDRLERENDNLRAALEWSYADSSPGGETPIGVTRRASRVERGIRLADAIEFFWVLRGHARENLLRVLALVALSVPGSAARARALTIATFLGGYTLGDYQAALPRADEAVAIWRSLDDPQGLAVALVRRGQIAVWTPDIPLATALFEEAREIFRRLRDDAGLTGPVDNHLAALAEARGDPDRAVTHHDEALAECRERGDHHGVAYSLREIARVRRAQGKGEDAIRLLRESLRLLEPLRDIRCVQLCLEEFAGAMSERGWTAEVARLFAASEALLALMGRSLSRDQAIIHDEHVATVKNRLDPETFAVAWREGRAMTMDQALGYALERLEST